MDEGKVINVAYAEDHTITRNGLKALLDQSSNIKITILAENGSDLLTSLQSAAELPDIVLLDINMPERNGFETQTELTARWQQIRTLVLTVYESELYIIRMIMLGARGYLLKNCSQKELETAIAAIYNRGYYYSQQADSALFHAIENNERKLPKLTASEREVIKYCCSDMSYAEIAKAMGTGTRSVQGFRDSLFKKLNVNSRTSLALLAVELGWVTLNNGVSRFEM